MGQQLGQMLWHYIVGSLPYQTAVDWRIRSLRRHWDIGVGLSTVLQSIEHIVSALTRGHVVHTLDVIVAIYNVFCAMGYVNSGLQLALSRVFGG